MHTYSVLRSNMTTVCNKHLYYNLLSGSHLNEYKLFRLGWILPFCVHHSCYKSYV